MEPVLRIDATDYPFVAVKYAPCSDYDWRFLAFLRIMAVLGNKTCMDMFGGTEYFYD